MALAPVSAQGAETSRDKIMENFRRVPAAIQRIAAWMCVFTALCLGMWAQAANNQAKVETIALPGLHDKVEILIDRWGVPHIYAKNDADLFFAQGFNAARDRLFQIDLWRRRGLGQLAEVFGPAFVEQDKAARLFLYRGDMKREWDCYSKDAQQIAASFVAGINAYIDWVGHHPEHLPFEFTKLNYKPTQWVTEDVVRIRSHGLTGNLDDEVARAKLACAGELSLDAVRLKLEPPWETKVPDGLDPCLPNDVLKVFDMATQDVRFSPITAEVEEVSQLQGESPADARAESNNWVVSSDKSANGRAIMANDPHREYLEPSLRYIADLSAPGLHVSGIGEPAVPGVSNGHNDWIAFGGTYFGIDQQDLYVYELNPANKNQYKYKGAWESFHVVHEKIEVKDHATAPVDLKFTRHGPLIYVDEGRNRAFAVRSEWLEPGTAPYMASLAYMRSRTFDEFKQALDGWGSPPINHVYADVKGNIGWAAMGFAPIRPNWDGLMPVPGDGRYEWAGHWTGDQLPRLYNPRAGYITTSNEMNLPADYPYKERKLGFEWSPPYRHQRIDETLSSRGKISIEDSTALQTDVVSIPARRLVALLQSLHSEDAETQAALKLLQGWSGTLDGDSPQAALEEVWFSRHLPQEFKEAAIGKSKADVVERVDPRVLLDGLEHPGTGSSPSTALRDHVLLSSLGAAYREIEKLQGSNPSKWEWGKLQFNLSEHPLSPLLDEAMRAKVNVGPIPKHGGRFTVNASSYRTSDFRQLGGPSARLVIDVGNWDNSRAVNHPGQSGDPDSPHYRDLAQMWRAGEYFPLLYSREAVEKAVEKRIELVPAGK